MGLARDCPWARWGPLVALLVAVTAYPNDVVVMDDGSALASRNSRELGEAIASTEGVEEEVETSSSLVSLKGTLDRMLKTGFREPKDDGDLGESASVGDITLDKLLDETCASHAQEGFYDSGSCRPDALIIRKLIAHLKQREAAGRPLSFKEYGKLETFYAIQSMAELSKIHNLKSKKHMTRAASHQLYEQENKVLNALHTETEIANHAEKASSPAEHVQHQALRTVAHSQHEIDVSKERLAHAEAAENKSLQLARRRHEEENSLLYKVWSDKGVLQAEQRAVQNGNPEQYSAVKGEKMEEAKMVAPIMRSVVPHIAAAVGHITGE